MGLVELGLQGRGVEAGEHLTVADVIVEVDLDAGDAPGDLGADRDRSPRLEASSRADLVGDLTADHGLAVEDHRGGPGSGEERDAGSGRSGSGSEAKYPAQDPAADAMVPFLGEDLGQSGVGVSGRGRHVEVGGRGQHGRFSKRQTRSSSAK